MNRRTFLKGLAGVLVTLKLGIGPDPVWAGVPEPDLSNLIYNIDPSEVGVPMTAATYVEPSFVTHEWQTDELVPWVARTRTVTLEELKEMGFDHDRVDELETRETQFHVLTPGQFEEVLNS